MIEAFQKSGLRHPELGFSIFKQLVPGQEILKYLPNGSQEFRMTNVF